MSSNLLLNICSDLTANVCAISRARNKNKDIIVSNPYIINNNIVWVTYLKTNNNGVKKINAKGLFFTSSETIFNFINSKGGLLDLNLEEYIINYSESFNQSNIVNRSKHLGNMVMLPLHNKSQEEALIENIVLDTVSKLLEVKGEK